jgi:hypothetical protein
MESPATRKQLVKRGLGHQLLGEAMQPDADTLRRSSILSPYSTDRSYPYRQNGNGMQQWMAEQMLAGAGVGYSQIRFAILPCIQAHGRQYPH